MPLPPNPFSTRNRAIYRPSVGQPSLPFPRSKGGKSRVPRENQNGIEQCAGGGGGGGGGRGGERDGTVSRAVVERVPVINSHRPPTDGRTENQVYMLYPRVETNQTIV